MKDEGGNGTHSIGMTFMDGADDTTDGGEPVKFSELLTAPHAALCHWSWESELAYVVWCHQGPKSNDGLDERL
jgi:hypothetical protein